MVEGSCHMSSEIMTTTGTQARLRLGMDEPWTDFGASIDSRGLGAGRQACAADRRGGLSSDAPRGRSRPSVPYNDGLRVNGGAARIFLGFRAESGSQRPNR